MRTQKIGNLLDGIEIKANNICQEFVGFTNGLRMIILLERKKDGGHNKEERRNLSSRFTFSSDEFQRALKELLLLKEMYPESRLYSSLNPRDTKKVIRQIERELLELHYCKDEVQTIYTHKKVIKSPRHFVMQQTCADDSLFLIDVDNIEGKDTYGESLKECEKLGVRILKTYQTKNGWHIITKPFNPSLWKLESEIKKDALILLDF